MVAICTSSGNYKWIFNELVGLRYITSTCAHMWEGEIDVAGKSCWSRYKCALSHHPSLKLEHQVYNVNSYEGTFLHKQSTSWILPSITMEDEINVMVLYVCWDTKIRCSICCGILVVYVLLMVLVLKYYKNNPFKPISHILQPKFRYL